MKEGISRTFVIIWLGQLVSVVGTNLTNFAVTIWVYQTTGDVTGLSLIFFAMAIPTIFLAPVAGVVTDRYDRRLVMLVSDVGAAISTVALVSLFFTGHLEVWHLYLTSGATAAFNAFQIPAYMASVPLLVSKEQFGRANGMVQTAFAAGQILAPLLGGMLVQLIGVGNVLLIDLGTFAFAVTTLALVRIPKPPESAEGRASRGSRMAEFLAGWHFVRRFPAFVYLLAFFAVTNFLAAMVAVLGTPLILSISTPAVLGTISSIGGVGLLVGSLVMSVWGGPKQRVHGFLGFQLISGLCIILAGVRPSVVLVGIGAFGFLFCMPIIAGSSEAIWQAKVKPDLLGRVFAVRRVLTSAARPIGYLLAGPTVDYLFEPLMGPGGALADSLGRVMGTGEGRGAGLLLVALGSLTVLAAMVAYLNPRLRNMQSEIPDADAEATSTDSAGSPATEGAGEGAIPTGDLAGAMASEAAAEGDFDDMEVQTLEK